MKYISFLTLLKKEIARYLVIWVQTILTPVISTSLYLLIFGISLGRQIEMLPNITYLEFIIPGLIMMGVINNSATNSSFSIFIAKIHGNIVDVLVAPISYTSTIIAYILASILRGFLVGISIFGIALLFNFNLPINIFFSLSVAFLSAWIFSCVGVVVGVWSQKFDHLGSFNTFFILPLVYLSGVFYSLQILPPFWQTVSKINPLFYMIDSFRYGYLGVSDFNPWYSLLILLILSIVLLFTILYIFRSGWKLKS
jgi:ABC-2 type transport system permease protein